MLPLIILLSSLVGAVIGLAMIAFKRNEHSEGESSGDDERVDHVEQSSEISKFSKPIPFGPFIAMAGWIALLWGEQIMDIYLRWSNLR